MKKFLAILLTLAVLSLCSICIAEEETASSFLFRGIPWYSAKSDAAESLTGLDSYSTRSNATMPDWFQRWQNIDGDYVVEEAGVCVRYRDVSVAGYNAELYTYYMYPIVDGRVSRNDDEAEFYEALYEFDTLTDMPAVYDDLYAKLTDLYGKSKELNNPDNWTNFTGRLWTAEDGSQIWLRNYFMYDTYTLKLTYVAPDATSRLEALEAQITQEKIEAEELERQQNSGNTDGL